MTDSLSNGAFPPAQGGGNVPAGIVASEIRSRRVHYKRVLALRSVRFWWYRILIIALGALAAAIVSQYFLLIWKPAIGCIVAAPILIWLFKRVEVGLFFTALVATALVPKAVDLKSLIIYPSIPFLFLLFAWLLLKTAFHNHKPTLPSFWAIWPHIGLLSLVVVSSIIDQLTWNHSVPHRVNQYPILYDEIVGVVMFFIPLITLVTTTAALHDKEQWIEYIQRMFLIVALVCSAILIIDFKRVGANVYTFRFTEPSIGWMTLRALAQIICLGAVISYARFLYATRRSTRVLYLVCLAICLLAVYFSLQNSWWLEVAAALMVMTIVYSRRLFFVCMLAVLPLLPFIKAEIDKLQTIKSNDYYRLIIWNDALRVWSKQALLGVGPGNFWAYDQRFTGLPIGLRNCTKSGLCVAHEGYLQVLGELGPLGLFFWLAMITLLIVAAARLYRRSKLRERPDSGLFGLIGLRLPASVAKSKDRKSSKLRGLRRLWAIAADDDVADYQVRKDRILGLVCLGMVSGSMVGDLFTSNFFLPPRQAYHTVQLPQVLTYWILYGCLLYKDKLWRNARSALRVAGENLRRVMRTTLAGSAPLQERNVKKELSKIN